MDTDKILHYCDDIDALTQAIRDELLIPPDLGAVWHPIAAGDDLQAAVSVSGAYVLAAGASFDAVDGYRPASVTAIRGLGDNRITSSGNAPALTIPINTHDVVVETLGIHAAACTRAVQVGRNDTEQTTVDVVPTGIRFRAVRSSGHRGKRPFEIDAADVAFADCEVHDAYDPDGMDSQAIWIGNAPGPVTINGGYFEAASETVMVGGDTMKIPNCRPTGITIRGATLTKPLAWKAAGIPKVKNLVELKDGHDVLIDQCELCHSWKSAQDGYCFMFTPSQGGSIRNAIVRNCIVHDVGGIVNITGTDASNLNPDRTQVSILGGEYRTNKATMGGSGRFCLITRGPEWFVVEGARITHEGSAFIEYGDKATMDLLRVVGSTWNYGTYGIRIGGLNHGDNSLGLIATVTIEDNIISGAHALFRTRYPHNTYIDNMTRDGEDIADAHADAHAADVAIELDRIRRWDDDYRM